MTAPTKMAKRAAAGTLALAVCLTGGVAGAGAAQAASNFKFDQRVAGEDRYGTAIAASKLAYPGSGAQSVVIVNAFAEVDGLTASYVSSLQNGPILYSDGSGISSATKAEIDRLGVKNVFLVGGTTVLKTELETQLKGYGYTIAKRYGGEDRYETASLASTSGTGKPAKVLLASGVSFADALVAAPLAHNKQYPILLVRANDVPSFTRNALNTLAQDNRIVIGGTSVVSDGTYNEAKATLRLAGSTRQGTAVKVAEHVTANEGFVKDSIGLVGHRNSNATDALSSSPFTGKNRIPLLFTDDGTTDTENYLKAHAAELTGKGYVFGGTNAVTDAQASAATSHAGGTGTNGSVGTIAVSPNDTANLSVVSNETVAGSNTQADADKDNRIFTASGLQNGKTYRITLVDSRNIAVDGNNVTFKSSADAASRSGFSADTGEDDADIVKVNGATPIFTSAAAGEARTTTAQPINGTITFEIDGQSVGDVTPVVYLNGGPDTTDADGGRSIRLETSATTAGQYAASTEPFGLGGKTTFSGAQAPTAAITGSTIDTVGKESNFFNTDPVGPANAPTTPAFRYNYDGNDTFTITEPGGSAVTVGITAFEAALSSGDTISGTYNRDAEAVSTFNLANNNPQRLDTLTANNGTGSNNGDVTLTGTTQATIDDLDQFVIQRANVTNPGVNETVGAFVTIATIAAVDTNTGTPATDFRYVDNDRPSGSYRYQVAPVNDGDTGEYTGTATAVTISSNDTTAPTVVDTRIANNAGNALALETGDSFTVVGSEPFAQPTAGAAVADNTAVGAPAGVDESAAAGTADVFRVQDGDGTIVDLINGRSAVFTRNSTPVTIGGTEYAANRVLTVTIGDLTGANAPATAGTVIGLGSQANITVQSGNTDEAGNQLVLTGDVAIDAE